MTDQEGRFEGVEEVAERLLVDPQTVRRWIKSGKLKAYKPGREYRILSHDLDAFLESRSSPKVQAPSPLELEKQRGASEQPEDDEPLYNQYEAFGLLLASHWRDELEKWDEEIPPGEVPSLFDFGRLFEWVIGIDSTKTLYEERAKDGHDTQRTEFQNTLRLMEEASQAARQKFFRTYEPIKTYSEFQKIVKENDLEAILSSEQGDE